MLRFGVTNGPCRRIYRSGNVFEGIETKTKRYWFHIYIFIEMALESMSSKMEISTSAIFKKTADQDMVVYIHIKFHSYR